MERNEMEALLQVIKRIEKKLDTVIRAIYEHDEDIQDECGRSQRAIDAGRSREAESDARDVLGYDNDKSSHRPMVKRSSDGEANPPRDHGEVQRKESIPGGNREGENVPRKNKGKRKYYPKRNAKQ